MVVAPALKAATGRPSLGDRLPVVRRRRHRRAGDPAELHLRRPQRDRRPSQRAPSASCSPRRCPGRYLVLGNLVVALALSSCRSLVLVGLSAVRGGEFHVSAPASRGRSGPRAVHRVHVRTSPRRWPAVIASPRSTSARSRSGDPAVLLRGRAVSDRRDAGRADRDRQGSSAHPRPRAAALRPGRPQRPGLHDIWGAGNVTARRGCKPRVVALSPRADWRSRSACSRALPSSSARLGCKRRTATSALQRV